MIAVLPSFKQKKSELFWQAYSAPQTPAAILHAFGRPAFCLAKKRCAHIFSVLPPGNKVVEMYVCHLLRVFTMLTLISNALQSEKTNFRSLKRTRI